MNVGGRHTQTRRHARRQMQLRTGGCCRAACPAWVASVLDLNGRCEARRGEVRSPPVSLCFSEYSKAFLLANDNHAIRLRIWRHFASNVRKKCGERRAAWARPWPYASTLDRDAPAAPGVRWARGAASIPFHSIGGRAYPRRGLDDGDMVPRVVIGQGGWR